MPIDHAAVARQIADTMADANTQLPPEHVADMDQVQAHIADRCRQLDLDLTDPTTAVAVLAGAELANVYGAACVERGSWTVDDHLPVSVAVSVVRLAVSRLFRGGR